MFRKRDSPKKVHGYKVKEQPNSLFVVDLNQNDPSSLVIGLRTEYLNPKNCFFGYVDLDIVAHDEDYPFQKDKDTTMYIGSYV